MTITNEEGNALVSILEEHMEAYKRVMEDIKDTIERIANLTSLLPKGPEPKQKKELDEALAGATERFDHFKDRYKECSKIVNTLKEQGAVNDGKSLYE